MATTKRRFKLVTANWKPTGQVFTGSTPGQAARKAATRGIKKIYLQETGKQQVREYKGTVKKTKLEKDTAWASAGTSVKKGNAKFVKVHN